MGPDCCCLAIPSYPVHGQRGLVIVRKNTYECEVIVGLSLIVAFNVGQLVLVVHGRAVLT
jgi:hypothetical protein